MGVGVRNTILQLAGTSKHTLPASLAIDEPPAHIPSIGPDEIQPLPCFIPVIIVIRKSAMKDLAADGKIVVGVLAGSSESKHVFGIFGRALERLEAAASGNLLDFGDVNVSLASMEVHCNGKPVALTALEFKTLKYFLLNPGRVVSRDELLNEVWGYRNYPYTRTVDNHIMKLRQKLEPQHRGLFIFRPSMALAISLCLRQPGTQPKSAKFWFIQKPSSVPGRRVVGVKEAEAA